MNKKINLYRFCDDGKVRMNSRDLNQEEMLLRYILSNLSIDEIKNYFDIDNEIPKNIIEDLASTTYPFAISFTYNYDDRFLWDSYTNNSGVCLEFSKQELYDYWISKGLESNISIDGVDQLLHDVIYDDKSQEEYIREWINGIIENKNEHFDLCKTLIFTCIFCKSPYWKPENECRAVFQSKYFGDKKYKVKENYNLKYNNGYKTQDYIEVPISKKLLKGITIGPINSKEKLELYIKNGLAKDIKDENERNNILEYFNSVKLRESTGKGVIRK